MLTKMSRYVEKIINKNMSSEQELKNTNPLQKEFETLLDKDLKTENLKKTK